MHFFDIVSGACIYIYKSEDLFIYLLFFFYQLAYI